MCETKWFEEARYGMFIHWGLYSLAGGIWKEKEIPGIGEQIMRFAKIPVVEYEKLAEQFNPVNYDPEGMVSLAKASGMKYIVITAKHHDGFALFPSQVSKFNIVDGSPYGKDLLKPLYEACQKQSIKFCIYYSHRQDWHEIGGAWQSWKNQYEGVSNRKQSFDEYMNQKALPQIKELLTAYPKTAYLWYDTSADMTAENSKKFYNLVKEMNPDCLVNTRVGNGFGDTVCFGDNQTPKLVSSKPAETPATINHTWGYKSNDHNWKTPMVIVDTVIECASRGSNLLLNIGPDGLGNIPQPCINSLTEAGHWIKENGKALYGTKGTPFPGDFPWGTASRRDNTIYLFVKKVPAGPLGIYGIENNIKSAYPLRQREEAISITRGGPGNLYTYLSLPDLISSDFPTVFVLELEGELSISQKLYPTAENIITLPVYQAQMLVSDISDSTITPLCLGESGSSENFAPHSGFLKWTFTVTEPASYELSLHSHRHWRKSWTVGTVLRIESAGQDYQVELKQDEELENARSHSYPESISRAGIINFDSVGKYEMQISVVKLGSNKAMAMYFDEDLDENTLSFCLDKGELRKL